MNSAGKTQRLLREAAADPDRSSVSAAQKIFSSEAEAEAAFLEFKTKLLTVDQWNKCAALTSFKLFDAAGKESASNISEGFRLRLSLTGALKYDWVAVSEIAESETETVVTVEPTHDPTLENADTSATSHFFTAESSNNFCLARDRRIVSLHVIGLKEKPNTAETKNTFEVVRNVATANIGYYFGIQKGEWQTFCENMLKSDQPDQPSNSV